MIKFIAGIQAYLKSQEGATAIEYGLIAGGISLGIVAALFAFGDDLARIFTSMAGVMNTRAGEVETDLGPAAP